MPKTVEQLNAEIARLTRDAEQDATKKQEMQRAGRDILVALSGIWTRSWTEDLLAPKRLAPPCNPPGRLLPSR